VKAAHDGLNQSLASAWVALQIRTGAAAAMERRGSFDGSVPAALAPAAAAR
jgi:hypothetical protein